MELATSPGIASHSLELPFDIYALIINSLVEYKDTPPRKELKALALTHRAFVAPCQKLLFWSVFYSVEAARKLVEIYDTSPHLAGYVRQLYFCNHHRIEIGHPSEFTVQFLSKFHDLSELIFTFAQSRLNLFDWTNLDSSVATALLTLLRSQSRLEKLQISGIKNFPLQGILSLASYRQPLKELGIFSVTVDFTDVAAQIVDFEASQSESIATGRQRRLATFKLFFGIGGGNHDALSVLTGSPDSPAKNLPILDISSIERLSVKWKHPNDHVWTKLLMQSSPRLRIFNLTLAKDSRMSFQGLATAVLDRPSHFQTISGMRLHSAARKNVDLFFGLSHEFQQLSGNVNALKKIDMSLIVCCSDSDTYAIYDMCASVTQQCKILDAILANGNAFPALRELTIEIEMLILERYRLSPWDTKHLESQFRGATTRVEKEGFKEVQTLLNSGHFSFELKMEWVDEF